MPAQTKDERSSKAQNLKVFQIEEGQYVVESEKGKILYKVITDNGSRRCTCADFISNSAKDPEFSCKHLLAAMGANGHSRKIEPLKKEKARLDERFISKIKGREFVVYNGLLDLGHKMGLKSVRAEVLQYPTKENGMTAICRAIVKTGTDEIYEEVGDANPGNVSSHIAPHVLRMAATRAKARALRDYTNIGMTCLEELADIADEPVGGGKPKKPAARKNEAAEKPKAAATSKNQKAADKPKATSNTGKADDKKAASKKSEESEEKSLEGQMSDAQKNAIFNIGKRRGLSEDELQAMAEETFNLSIDGLSAQDASAFIRNLQQAA